MWDARGLIISGASLHLGELGGVAAWGGDFSQVGPCFSGSSLSASSQLMQFSQFLKALFSWTIYTSFHLLLLQILVIIH